MDDHLTTTRGRHALPLTDADRADRDRLARRLIDHGANAAVRGLAMRAAAIREQVALHTGHGPRHLGPLDVAQEFAALTWVTR